MFLVSLVQYPSKNLNQSSFTDQDMSLKIKTIIMPTMTNVQESLLHDYSEVIFCDQLSKINLLFEFMRILLLIIDKISNTYKESTILTSEYETEKKKIII